MLVETLQYFEAPNGDYITNREVSIHKNHLYTARKNKNPKDWRHKNMDFWTLVGQDLFVNGLTNREVAKKHGICEQTVKNFAAAMQPEGYERVRIERNQKVWRKKKQMYIKLEVELENKSFSASELIMALSKTVQKLYGGVGSGPILDREDKQIGTWQCSNDQ